MKNSSHCHEVKRLILDAAKSKSPKKQLSPRRAPSDTLLLVSQPLTAMEEGGLFPSRVHPWDDATLTVDP